MEPHLPQVLKRLIVTDVFLDLDFEAAHRHQEEQKRREDIDARILQWTRKYAGFKIHREHTYAKTLVDHTCIKLNYTRRKQKGRSLTSGKLLAHMLCKP
ncbi:hypothetical protein DPMN_181263 [Dreissena polymorpha]|uniref:Uncharacterized protein n=1 Tax=Dreissena polymorpha TaxID=45954 RepID=A0A9D4I1F7_DREPO|nr:hypothetical protein DPMN_181263 [Dreissena polymorpha]